MNYLRFSFGFFLFHFISYTTAGMIDLQLSRSIYIGKNRLFKSFRDMSDQKESFRIAYMTIISQFFRAILMSIVLYPILPTLKNLSFLTQFLFISGLMFIYADFASAIPFSNTLEGLVYLKKEFVKPNIFWIIQLEAIIYAFIFGLLFATFLV